MLKVLTCSMGGVRYVIIVHSHEVLVDRTNVRHDIVLKNLLDTPPSARFVTLLTIKTSSVLLPNKI